MAVKSLKEVGGVGIRFKIIRERVKAGSIRTNETLKLIFYKVWEREAVLKETYIFPKEINEKWTDHCIVSQM